MKSPFFLREIALDDSFCDRELELKELCNHGRSFTNIVLYSPRRYGKTSLVKRVQATLANEGVITVYCQFYGVISEEDVASRFAKAIFSVTHQHESIFRKAARLFTAYRPVMTVETGTEKGLLLSVQLTKTNLSGHDLLEDVMESIDSFVQNVGVPIHIVLDEFQEITTLPNSRRIEGLLREHIQRQKASYLFVGSRRGILLSMFNERRRPFYASAINYPLPPLPEVDFQQFIIDEFCKSGKNCESEASKKIVKLVECYPYYGQKLAYFVFNLVEKTATVADVDEAFELLLKEETPVFESIYMGLSTQQITLLHALANEPANSIYAQEYMNRHRLGSIGGVQSALKKLVLLDLIERVPTAGWRIVDPIFSKWIVKNS